MHLWHPDENTIPTNPTSAARDGFVCAFWVVDRAFTWIGRVAGARVCVCVDMLDGVGQVHHRLRQHEWLDASRHR